MRLLVIALMVLCPLSQASTGDQAYRAFQLRASNIDSAPRGGPDAIAGRGDWWLSNGRLCAAVSDVEHDAGIIAGGGSLIDFGYCDRSDDQWTYTNLLTGLAKEKAIRAQSISASAEKDHAEVRVTGEAEGLRQTLSYVFDNEDPEALSLWVEVERTAPGRAVRMSGLLTLYPHRALTPYGLSTIAPAYSLGFNHPFIDRNNVFSLVKGMMPADWNILVGSHAEAESISYGVQLESAYLTDREGVDHRLPQFLVILPDYSMHGWMTRPLWWDSEKPGLPQMLQSQLMDLAVGERMVVHFRLLAGKRADVASVTDRVYAGPKLRGSVNVAPVVLEVFSEDGRSLTQRRVNYPGKFSLKIPDNLMNVRVVARSPWGEILEKSPRIAGDTNLGALIFSQRSELRLPRRQAMMLTFFGLGDTPDPRFGDDMLEFREAGQLVEHSLASNKVYLAGIESDPRSVFLPPGEYEVVASRGLEHELSKARLTVRAGEVAALDIAAPKPALQTDWKAADFHVHAGASFDSSLPLLERLRSFAAQDADILVLSEHNRIVDGREAVKQAGLEQRIHLINGVELTGMARTATVPNSIGHANAFPVHFRGDLFAGGVPRVEDRRLRELIRDTRYRYPRALFQLNHPRSDDPIDDDLAFFDHLSQGTPFESVLPLSHARNRSLLELGESGFRDIDFDAMEVLNGAEMNAYRVALRDWLALLNQGYAVRATGNSDSHGLADMIAIPRNYLRLDCAFDERSDHCVTDALHRGEAFLTSGPLVSVQSAGHSVIGATLRGEEQDIDIRADAASWVGVNTLRIYLNGRLWREQAITAGQSYSEKVHVKRDSVLVVEVSGVAGAEYRRLFPGLQPVALTNPVYIDADDDGRWQAPGVP